MYEEGQTLCLTLISSKIYKLKHYLLALLTLLIATNSPAQTLPKPKHLVVIMLENRDYTDIVGNSLAPYINSLLSDTDAAVFTQAYGSVSGSEPNYLYLFSGSSQGISGDSITAVQFTTCNLGASLIANGYSFAGYSEDLPSVGYLGTSYANYARKHNSWSDWQGSGTNQLPVTTNLPFTSFPTNYDSLPTVAFVVPNEVDNMHTPSTSAAITPGDTWFHNHMDGYIQWAKTNNSMLLFTYDESSSPTIQHILVFFIGQGVKGGSYPETIGFKDLLRTIEGMYSLPYCAGSATANTITDVWKNSPSGVHETNAPSNSIQLWPVPAKGVLHIDIISTDADKVQMLITDLAGKTIQATEAHIITGKNEITEPIESLQTGMYLIRISGKYMNKCQKLVIE